MFKKIVSLTVGVSALFLFSAGAGAEASSSVANYYVIDTQTPMSEFQLRDLCNQSTQKAANKLTEVASRLAGNPTSLQVGGFYGITPLTPQPPGLPPRPGQPYRYYCVLKFVSHDASLGYNAFSAVHHTHLSSADWDTACRPEFDALVKDPNTVVTNYLKNATLFQGRICEVITVQVEKK